ncbi:hypothetical protein KEM63_09230 [Halopseudomonas nanhaiensis]|uniref:hypothetical protein n=1 Tax=Halopseudomonas nanhaiensis TaxID=2830842 RepID=UPI001CBFBC39|nr:hypothetical protein [Halopseudomonas nanhaiensis]UAW97019.1 hypothetical protein KEM63_09230 [Halopseudomonas nanhaiensis]
MQFYVLAGLLAVMAVALLALALRLGGRFGWVAAWMRGNLMLVLLALVAVLALAAFDVSRFQSLERSSQVATLQLHETGPQRFEVLLEGAELSRMMVVHGDMWDLDVQVLRWNGLAQLLGLKDGYRLNRMSGRFVALEQQEAASNAQPRGLNDTPAWRDIWLWLDRLHEPVLVEADAFVVRFMPLVDGARYRLDIGPTGITPVPLNEQAERQFRPQ